MRVSKIGLVLGKGGSDQIFFMWQCASRKSSNRPAIVLRCDEWTVGWSAFEMQILTYEEKT